MDDIKGVRRSNYNNNQDIGNKPKDSDKGGGFGNFMGKVADGALAGLSAVAPMMPGGELISRAADGLRGRRGSAPGGLSSAKDEQMDKMWQMQEENQMFNLQYLQLQTELQADNRRFSTMSNLMKARHDTAKSAINNMHV